MTEKDLASKKISELQFVEETDDINKEYVRVWLTDERRDMVIRILKQWAIAKIENCQNKVRIDGYGVYILEPCSDKLRCQSCIDRMKDFEITEEELK